jgi:hypothetical protein
MTGYLEGSCSIQLSYGVRGWKKCRGGRIRTYDLLVPNQARYRATLHPEVFNYELKIVVKQFLTHNSKCGEGGIRTPGNL